MAGKPPTKPVYDCKVMIDHRWRAAWCQKNDDDTMWHYLLSATANYVCGSVAIGSDEILIGDLIPPELAHEFTRYY